MSDIAPGTYRGRAVGGALGETSSGGEQVAVEFELMDSTGAVGPHILWYGYFTEKAFDHTIRALRVCGWKGDMLTDLSGLTDNEVSLVIESETYEGRTKSRVRWVNPAGDVGLGLKAPLTGDKARAFAAKMRGRIAGVDQAERSRTERPQPYGRRTGGMPPEPPPHDDGDMPPF